MKGWYQITVVQSSCTCTATEARDWRRDQRAFFCHYNANRHRWLWPEQGIKSVGQHPMGEPWASPWSHMTVIGRKIATAKCGQFTFYGTKKKKNVHENSIKFLLRNSCLCCQCCHTLGTSSGFHLVVMGTFIHINLVRHLELFSQRDPQ